MFKSMFVTRKMEGDNEEGAGRRTELSAGALAGIVAGCIVGGILLGAVVVKMVQRGRCGRELQSYSHESSREMAEATVPVGMPDPTHSSGFPPAVDDYRYLW
jgi:hypothetical protein